MDERINLIKDKFHNTSDLFTRSLKIGNTNVFYAVMESVSSDDKIGNLFLRSISNDIKYLNNINDIFTFLENTIPNSKMVIVEEFEKVFYYLPNGFTTIFVENNPSFIAIETRMKLDRGVVESSTEVVIRGPKDSFTENHLMNMGLIRKRIKDTDLVFEDFIVGDLTETKVTIAYMNDIVNKEQVSHVSKKLKNAKKDVILDSGYIRRLLSDSITTFPKMISTERPDLVSMHLLKGKIIILVENSPIVLIAPGYFGDFFVNPEDKFALPINSLMNKIIRILAFLITLIMPALYIAITCFNRELIPIQLLISLATQLKMLPFPIFFEILLLVTIFEILREGDIRVPSKMGSSISIVGGLILGDAAVSAGIVSPIAVIIVAITSICGLLFSDIDFVNGLRLWRYLFIIGASFFGIIGIGIVGTTLLIHIISLHVLGHHYIGRLG